MSLQGNIEEVGLGAVIQMLSLNQYRGTLRIETEEGGSQFFFMSEGEIVLVRQVKKDPVRLGDLLLRSGKISTDQLDTALAEQKKKRGTQRLGKTLVDLAMIQQDQIEDAVRTKFEEDFLDMFLLDKGRFEFIFGLTPEALFGPEEKLERVSIDSGGVMLEAVKRIDEWQEIVRDLGSLDTIYRNRMATMGPKIEDYDLEGVSLHPQARKELYDLLDGDHSLRGVITSALREGIATRLETFVFLHRLKANDLVRPLDFKTLLGEAKQALASGDVPGTAKYIRAILGRKDTIDLSLIRRYLEFLKKYKRPRLAFAEARRFAAQLLAKGEADPAIELYEVAIGIERNSETIDRLFYALLRANKRKRAVEVGLLLRDYLGSDAELSVAVRVSKNISELDPKNPEVLELEGLIFMRQERNEEAIVCFDQALGRSEPEDARRSHIVDAILTLQPERNELRDEQASRELQHAELMLKREIRRRRAFVLGSLILVVLVWRTYAEYRARVVMDTVEELAAEDDIDLNDVKRLGKKIDEVLSYGFTTVRGRAEELELENEKAWTRITQERSAETDSRVQETRDAEAGAIAKVARDKKAEELKAALDSYAALVKEGAFEKASANAASVANVYGEEFPDETKVLRVFTLVSTTPPGASVVVGGKTLGKTPVHIGVALGGSLPVTIRQPGFQPLRETLAGAGYAKVGYELVPGPTWSVALAQEPLTAEIAADGSVVVALPSGVLTALDAKTGERLWKTKVLDPGSGVGLTGLSVSGAYAIATYAKGVVAVALDSGKEVWRKASLGAKTLEPTAIALPGKAAVLVASGPVLYLLDAKTGAAIQDPPVRFESPILLSPTAGGSGRAMRAFVALKSSVVAIDLSNANGGDVAAVLWTSAKTAATGAPFYSASAEALIVPVGNAFRALGEAQGDTVADLAPGVGPLRGTTLIGERLSVLGQNSFMLTLSVYTGKVLWAGKKVLKSVSAGPVAVGKDLVVVSGDGKFHRYTSGGRERTIAPISLGAPVSGSLRATGEHVVAVSGTTVYLVNVSVRP
jgi:tetratricopeptide (TPR) repeat protein